VEFPALLRGFETKSIHQEGKGRSDYRKLFAELLQPGAGPTITDAMERRP
jgi:hypothetical protein